MTINHEQLEAEARTYPDGSDLEAAYLAKCEEARELRSHRDILGCAMLAVNEATVRHISPCRDQTTASECVNEILRATDNEKVNPVIFAVRKALEPK
jgi:hypothetical protein